MNPKVSIITRTRERALLLRRAVESVVQQSFDDWELVVINDGGPREEVANVLRDYRRRNGQKIRLLHNEGSGGMEAATNLGIASSAGDYIAIHDDDDSWDKGFLATTVGWLEEHSRSSVWGGVITHCMKVAERVQEGQLTEVYREPYNHWIESVSLFRMAGANIFPPISFVYRRRVLDEVGLYREDLPVMGDWEFNLRFLRKYEIAVIPRLLAHYHQRVGRTRGSYAGSVTAARGRHRRTESRIRNDLLREDVEQGAWGLGFLAHLSQNTIESDWRPVEKAVSAEMRRDLQQIARRGKRIAVFGASISGRSWVRWLKRHFAHLEIVCFFDNDDRKWHKTVDGIMVRPPWAITERKFDTILVASSGHDEIAAQLEDSGLREHHDFHLL
ncbi:MAG: glycosyltransferase [Desulfobacterales bacterium]|nr:MAG: glycosyltransferase [Desulfobacterales bacterium]